MELAPAQASLARALLSDLRRRAEAAEQAPDLDAAIEALSAVWNATTRAQLNLRQIRDDIRREAQKTIGEAA